MSKLLLMSVGAAMQVVRAVLEVLPSELGGVRDDLLTAMSRLESAKKKLEETE